MVILPTLCLNLISYFMFSYLGIHWGFNYILLSWVTSDISEIEFSASQSTVADSLPLATQNVKLLSLPALANFVGINSL